MSIHEAYTALLGWFPRETHIVVAYSGGVDSSLVLKAAVEACGVHRVTAITADSASLPRAELTAARRFSHSLEVSHELLKTSELSDPAYVANQTDRCFFCKKALYLAIDELLSDFATNTASIIVDGLNTDDLKEHRPGVSAGKPHAVQHPLVDTGFSKALVREVARTLGLPMWNKPAMACLASRIQHGISVTEERLALVESGEALLQQAGFLSARLRYHELPQEQLHGPEQSPTQALKLARIEVPIGELHLLSLEQTRASLTQGLRALGFTFVTVDLEGYKSGGRPEVTVGGSR